MGVSKLGSDRNLEALIDSECQQKSVEGTSSAAKFALLLRSCFFSSFEA